MMLRRNLGLPTLLMALALTIAGCSKDCVNCSSPRGPTANILSADFNLCLSEFPNAGVEFSECTVVNLEYVVVD
jgi:hypothetical protein